MSVARDYKISIERTSNVIAEFEKTNDDYLWNAMWSIYSTSTTVGYGDVLATTHCGRMVAALSSFLGLAMT